MPLPTANKKATKTTPSKSANAQGGQIETGKDSVTTTIHDEGNTPPANRPGSITISGEAKEDTTLTATVQDEDGVPNNVQYQWLRDGKAIDGAHNKTYVLRPDDVGHKISVRATYKDNAQHDESPLSSETGAVVAKPAQPPQQNHPGSVSIKGEAKVGSELKAEVTDEDGVPKDIQYRWLRDGKEIEGANGDRYTLKADDAGHKISVKAYYQDKAYHNESPESSALDVAKDGTPPSANHAPTGTVTVSGLGQVGETLHAGNTLADEDGMGEVSYQWLRDGQEISGANSAQYTLTNADVGHDISVRASYTDQKANAESKDSLSSLKPAEAGTAPTYENNYGQTTIDWAGFKWVARDKWYENGSPHANGQWSKDNVQQHDSSLDLSITNDDGKTPVASEIISTRSMGYGTYEMTFKGDFSTFDKIYRLLAASSPSTGITRMARKTTATAKSTRWKSRAGDKTN